jgi:hypothetical protein
LLRITSDQYAQLSSLYFTVGGVSYELTANGQIWPRSLNSAIGGTTDSIYLVVANSGSASGSGLDFTNGYCFLYAELQFYRENKSLNCSSTASGFTRCTTRQTLESALPPLSTPLPRQIKSHSFER